MKENTSISDEEFKKMLIHYKKINLFGYSYVGKSSLIQLFEKYTDSNFKIEDGGTINMEDENKKLKLVEQIKRVTVNYNNSEIYLNIYETSLKSMEIIKKNLDALLLYSECIILMIDISSIQSFKNVSELLPLIMKSAKETNILPNGMPPIYLLINKTDLEDAREVSGFEIKELIDQYPDIKNMEISLLNKLSFQEFLKDFNETLKKEENKQTYDHIHKVKIQDPVHINKNIENISSLSLFLLGSSMVGKTSFIRKFINNSFTEITTSTMGLDVERTIVKVGDTILKLEIWDTAGQERLRSLPKKYYSKGNGFLLFYDVTERKSFEDINGWINDIREERGDTKEILFLLGNKIDIIENRKVPKEEAQQLADNKDMNYFELSCKDGINVYEIVSKLIFESFSKEKGYQTNIKLDNNVNNNKRKKNCC